MPTTAAQPYFHQPSVTPISTATRGMPVGNTAFLYLVSSRSNVVVLGMDTTRTATVSPFHARCYANGTLCLGADTAVATFDQPSVYLYQTQPTPSVQRLGYLSTFAEAAQCRP